MLSSLLICESAAIGFGGTAGLMPLARRACVRWKITAPRAGNQTSEWVPSLGGPAIVAGTLCGLALTTGMPLWLGLPVLMLCVAGVIDDIAVLTPLQKLALEVVTASLLILRGPRFVFTGWAPMDLAIAIFWLVTAANAFNLIDGLDGLAAGIGAVSTTTIATVAFMYHNVPLGLGAVALVAALAAFLLFNWSPASIFMGDSGALPIGMLIGFMALQAGGSAVSAPLARYIVPVLLMMVPLLDTSVVTISRLATGQPISRGGHDHSHHRLLRFGFSTPCAVTVCCITTLAFGLCALTAVTLTQTQLIAIVPFVAIGAAVLALFMANLSFDVIEPGNVYSSLQGVAKIALHCVYKWRVADVMLDAANVSAAYFGAYLIRMDFSIPDEFFHQLLRNLWQVLLVSYSALFVAGVYRNIWRHTELSDATRFAKAAVVASGMLILWQGNPVSWSIIILFAILLFNLLTATRLSFVVLRRALAKLGRSRTVLIVGVTATADTALQFFMSSFSGGWCHVIGFLDDDGFKHGKVIRGVPVLGSIADLDNVYVRSKFDELVLASDSIPPSQLTFLSSFAHRKGVSLSNFIVGARPAV